MRKFKNILFDVDKYFWGGTYTNQNGGHYGNNGGTYQTTGNNGGSYGGGNSDFAELKKLLLELLNKKFESSKSFYGRTQFINKQTGQSVTCEDIKSFIQQEMYALQPQHVQEITQWPIKWLFKPSLMTFANKQMRKLLWSIWKINGNINTGVINGNMIYNHQQQWNMYPTHNEMQQRSSDYRDYNYYG